MATPVNSKTISLLSLQMYLLEAAGGQVLAEFVLDEMLREQLSRRQLTIDAERLEAERVILLSALDPDQNQAQLLLDELREQQGLGERRYSQLLWRNAALRLLVQDDVEVSPASIEQAFEFEYGARYEARLLVVDSLPLAADLTRQAREADANFTRLVIEHSTDSSRAQGGLLPPISTVDGTFPAIVRQSVAELAPGQVSDPMALDRGFAILKLERKIDAEPVRIDDVRDELTLGVRRQVEQMLMRQRARALIAEAKVIILDPALHKSWTEQKKRILE